MGPGSPTPFAVSTSVAPWRMREPLPRPRYRPACPGERDERGRLLAVLQGVHQDLEAVRVRARLRVGKVDAVGLRVDRHRARAALGRQGLDGRQLVGFDL